MEETGQGMAEYALILTFVALAVITALTFMGNAIQGSFEQTGGLFGVSEQ
ncbi:MAG: Flp family type IVb pilin [Bacillota bacterium]|nr:Flp family type IVb pilin [Bacillota bacterium]